VINLEVANHISNSIHSEKKSIGSNSAVALNLQRDIEWIGTRLSMKYTNTGSSYFSPGNILLQANQKELKVFSKTTISRFLKLNLDYTTLEIGKTHSVGAILESQIRSAALTFLGKKSNSYSIKYSFGSMNIENMKA